MMLPDPAASQVVLIGVDAYQSLEDLPAVANNVTRLAALLAAEDLWGLPPENLTVLSNPVSKDDVLDAVHDAATQAEEALLVYYAGHGLLTADAELHLALPHTHLERLYRSVDYDDVRELVVRTGRASARVVILDCCYSGSALTGYMSAATSIANHAMAEGTYLMTSTAETKPAMAPPGEKYTAFTGELLRAIEDGVPQAPDPLTMEVLFAEVRDRIAARTGIPAPQQRSRNSGHAIALVHNRSRQDAVAERPFAQRREGPEDEPAPVDPLPASEASPSVAVAGSPPRLTPSRTVVALLHPVLIVLAVLLGPLAGLLYVVNPGEACGDKSGLTQMNGECIGVSDGSFSFMPELDDVSERIMSENARVGDDRPSATIALLGPMTARDTVTKTRILHRIQGAFLAQRQANGSGNAVSVRLLLAHPGNDARYWGPVAEQLAGMAVSTRDNLRAIVGFDVSNADVGEAVKHLAGRGVPGVGGTFTPGKPHAFGSGIAWIMPSVKEQVAALQSNRQERPRERIMLVQDVNADPYARDLGSAASEGLEGVLSQAANFDSGSDEAVTRAELQGIARAMCAVAEDVKQVFFAGRALHLREFVNALGHRKCQQRKIKVVSGTEAAALFEDRELDWSVLSHSGITVEYASVAHPDAWPQPGNPGTESLAEVVDELERLGQYLGEGATFDLLDAEAISAYDSSLTAIKAIRATSAQGVPSAVAVAVELLGVGDDVTVVGASGWICMGADGLARSKAVQVVEVDAEHRQPRLVATEWPKESASKGGLCGT